jgi:DNA repair exonuclease SbcCD ATPase subunit
MDSGSARIKYVNVSNRGDAKPSGLQDKSTREKHSSAPAPAGKTQTQKQKAAPNTVAPMPAHRAQREELDPERALETYEQCRKAFNELAALHSDAQGEAAAASRRLERTEQELRRERELGARYAAQIAAQETELRRVREGKKAVEDLNSRLNGKLAAGGPDQKLAAAHKAATEERDRLKATHKTTTEERDRLKAAHKAATEERDRIKAAHKAVAEERDKANEYAAFCDDMMEHVGKAVELCARACDQHAPDTARDMRETGETLKAMRRATLTA